MEESIYLFFETAKLELKFVLVLCIKGVEMDVLNSVENPEGAVGIKLTVLTFG